MECPKCKLESPDGAQRCDCGYDFELKEIKGSYCTEKPVKSDFRDFLDKIFTERNAWLFIVCSISALRYGVGLELSVIDIGIITGILYAIYRVLYLSIKYIK